MNFGTGLMYLYDSEAVGIAVPLFLTWRWKAVANLVWESIGEISIG